VSTSVFSLKHQTWNRPQFSATCKIWCTSIKNSRHNNSKIDLINQGAYHTGKPRNLREFVKSGKLRENSGNLKFTQRIYQMLAFFVTQSEAYKMSKFAWLQ